MQARVVERHNKQRLHDNDTCRTSHRSHAQQEKRGTPPHTLLSWAQAHLHAKCKVPAPARPGKMSGGFFPIPVNPLGS